MLNTLTDQIHFHRRKTCSPVHDGIEHHGQVFVIFIEPAGVIAFLHDQAKAARLAGQQRLTGGGRPGETALHGLLHRDVNIRSRMWHCRRLTVTASQLVSG